MVEGFRMFSEGTKYSFLLTNLDAATNRVRSGIVLNPSTRGSSIINISKISYTQSEAVDIVNASLLILQKRELNEKNQIAYNTRNYIKKQMGIVKEKVDSSYTDYQNLQKRENTYDMPADKGNVLSNILDLEKEKVGYQERISALNSVSNNVRQSGTDGMISLEIAGLNEGNFVTEVGELKSLEEQRKEMVLLYQPSAREVKELDQKIGEAKNRIQNAINSNRAKIDRELADINSKLSQYEGEAYNLPEKEKKFLDASRGYIINDALYAELLAKLSQAELSIASIFRTLPLLTMQKT